MPESMSTVSDPIYIELVQLRDKLINDFGSIRNIVGDDVYKMIFKNVQQEHDELLAKIDERINTRIMQLAIEDLM